MHLEIVKFQLIQSTVRELQVLKIMFISTSSLGSLSLYILSTTCTVLLIELTERNSHVFSPKTLLAILSKYCVSGLFSSASSCWKSW